MVGWDTLPYLFLSVLLKLLFYAHIHVLPYMYIYSIMTNDFYIAIPGHIISLQFIYMFLNER